MPGLTLEVDDGPVFFPLFQMLDPQTDSFVTPQTTSQEQRKESPVPPVLQPGAIWRLPKGHALFAGEPVAHPHTQISSIATTSRTTAANHPTQVWKWLRPGGAILASLLSLIWPRSSRKRSFTMWMVFVFAVVLVSAQGCGGNSRKSSGGGGSNAGTPAGTYTITITGTTNAGGTTLTHSLLVKLTVN